MRETFVISPVGRICFGRAGHGAGSLICFYSVKDDTYYELTVDVRRKNVVHCSVIRE